MPLRAVSGQFAALFSAVWLAGLPIATFSFMAGFGPSGGLVGVSTGVLTGIPLLTLWFGPPLIVVLSWLAGRRARRSAQPPEGPARG